MKFVWIVLFVCVKCSAMSRSELDDFADYLHRTSQLDLNLKKGADPDDIFEEEEEVSDHAWEESGKFEGDLILNDRQRRLIVENVEGLSRNGLTDTTKRWPNNEVIYFIQKEHFNGAQVQAIQDGIDDLAQASCVKFRPYKKGDRDAVVIQGSRRGCFSQVGYQGGYQVLNLSGRHPAGRGCFRHGTVVHELLHTLGFYHMQSSPDRDDYINVLWENILQPARHNFRKYNSYAVSDFGVGYDYDSVLHYSRRAFSSNGKDTLVPKMRGAEIGQRVGLSPKDTEKLNKMYCDSESNLFDADEIPLKTKNKKKKPRNQPFEGHGIGYHQGKTVIIKVPTSETYKIRPESETPVEIYDFSATPQRLPAPETDDYTFANELKYPYQMLGGNNDERPAIIQGSSAETAGVEEEEMDEDLKEAFERLAKIAKQNIYTEDDDTKFHINRDYSEFYPSQIKKKEPSVRYYNGKYKEMILEKSPELYHRISDNNNKNKNKAETSAENVAPEDFSDSSYRTSLPMRKPYSAYEQTETPAYATREYLKDRENYSPLYSQEPEIKEGWYSIFNQEVPVKVEAWYQKPVDKDYEDSDKNSQEDGSYESYDIDRENSPKRGEEYSYIPSPWSRSWSKSQDKPPSSGAVMSSEVNDEDNR